MITKLWRHGRRAGLAGALAAGLLAAGAVTGLSAAGAAPTGAPPGPAVGNPTGSAAAALASAPLRQAGPGWALAEYTTRTQAQRGPTTLYLVSPGGARYALYTWRASATWAPNLIAWSGDKTRALLSASSGQFEQITLATGAVSYFRLPGMAEPMGYTRPSGLNILGFTLSAKAEMVARYSLTGKLVKVLASGPGQFDAIYSPDGTVLAVSGTRGLSLISNAGGVIRRLPIPGTDPRMGAYPVRWWNSTTILARATATGKSMDRLWLVPASGARAVPLTPQRNSGQGGDYGDRDAWRLPSGLYLQSFTHAGLAIFRQAANGSIAPVAVPRTTGNLTRVVTAAGARLLVQAQTGPSGSNSLLWYDPGTHAAQWLLRAPVNAFGVTAVVPYYARENIPFL
jgi:hypothetical protein